MKLFVISDTHGRLDKVIQVFEKLKDIDLIVHLGDFQSDARQLKDILHTPVLSVRGNLDGVESGKDYKTLDTEWGRILLAHGHLDHVKSSVLSLKYRAEELGCKAALFGHTHRPYYDEYDGIYLLNPGSLSIPRDGTKGSYAIITTTPDTFSSAIVYYSSIFPKKKPPKGGVLRDLLNNSDRF